jgi:hypothetical protein
MKGLDESSTAILADMVELLKVPYEAQPLLQAIYNLGVIDGQIKQLREMVKE